MKTFTAAIALFACLAAMASAGINPNDLVVTVNDESIAQDADGNVAVNMEDNTPTDRM